ncbi:MAG: SlyX family protein [Hydrogenophaga sp.]|nr:SlyX family protein [Hydrogenophaga sp.]
MSSAAPTPHPAPAAPATDALEQRLTELEIKASYADDLLDTLNQLVARQQETIELLVREVSRLRQQGGEGASPGVRDPRDELPPHY